jgi:small-conductance mechanosensitive channel
MFRVDENGNPLRRSFMVSVLLMFGSVAAVLWILFWLFVMPVLLARHFVVNGFMWFEWLVMAIIFSLIVFGRKRGLDRRLIGAATPTKIE